MPLFPPFDRECSVTTILADRVDAGQFAGGDQRVSFRGQPARRGQPFVALWVSSFPADPSCTRGVCVQGDLGAWWATFLAREFERPLGPLEPGTLVACLLPSPEPQADAILLLTVATTGARKRRRSRTAPAAAMPVGESTGFGSDSGSDFGGLWDSDDNEEACDDGWDDWDEDDMPACPAYDVGSLPGWAPIPF